MTYIFPIIFILKLVSNPCKNFCTIIWHQKPTVGSFGCTSIFIKNGSEKFSSWFISDFCWLSIRRSTFFVFRVTLKLRNKLLKILFSKLKKKIKKIAWIRYHHFHLQKKFKSKGKTLLGSVNKLWKQKVCWQHPGLFCLSPQANFPTHNLNFHWQWRWWDQIQATF